MSQIANRPSRGNDNSTRAEQLERDLFGRPIHPLPGHVKGSATSREAAEAIAPIASGWRATVAKLYADAHPSGFTADEAAEKLAASPFLIRPRVSELAASGDIEKTGERRRNSSSKMSAFVWAASARLLRSAPSIVPEAGSDCT
jgi:hypothetical protein